REAMAATDDASGQAVVGRALQKLEDASCEPDVLCAPNDQAAALLQTFLAERATQDGKVVDAHADAQEAAFDTHDAGWIRAFVPWVREKLGIAKRAPRPPLSDASTRMNDLVRIAVLGDWGTGLYGAPACANSILRDGAYQALLHLGDVYYTGSEKEEADHFLKVWPKVP